MDSLLNEIGYNAFDLCTNLHSFEYPPSIEIIENEAFNCKKFKLIN